MNVNYQIWKIVRINFMKWKKSYNVKLAFTLAFILCLMMTEKAIDVSQNYHTIMQVFEPFLWIYGDAESVLLSSLLLLLFFLDMPFIDASTPYYLSRVKRTTWIAGQIVYVILVTITYCVFLLVTTTLMYSLFLVSLNMLFNIRKSRKMGIIVTLGVSGYGLVLSPEVFQIIFSLSELQNYQANILTGWLSPLNHATYHMHSFGYDYLPSLQISILIFTSLISVNIILIYKGVRKYEFTFSGISM